MKKLKTTNPELIKIIRALKRESREENVRIWRDIAGRLGKPRRKRVTVNVSRINRHTESKETVVVPGKVLGAGEIDHPVTIAALAFSEKAKEKIETAKGKCLSLPELVKKKTKGSQPKIIG